MKTNFAFWTTDIISHIHTQKQSLDFDCIISVSYYSLTWQIWVITVFLKWLFVYNFISFLTFKLILANGARIEEKTFLRFLLIFSSSHCLLNEIHKAASLLFLFSFWHNWFVFFSCSLFRHIYAQQKSIEKIWMCLLSSWGLWADIWVCNFLCVRLLLLKEN